MNFGLNLKRTTSSNELLNSFLALRYNSYSHFTILWSDLRVLHANQQITAPPAIPSVAYSYFGSCCFLCWSVKIFTFTARGSSENGVFFTWFCWWVMVILWVKHVCAIVSSVYQLSFGGESTHRVSYQLEPGEKALVLRQAFPQLKVVLFLLCRTVLVDHQR